MSKFNLLLIFLLIFSLLFCVQSESCSSDSDCGTDIKYKLCLDGTCSQCSIDAECDGTDVCTTGYCEISPLFNPFNQWQIYGLIGILLGSMLAAGGGLGGGGIFVPVFILIVGFSTKSAAALSQATIFGGSIVNLIMNFREKHPIRKHRPLPDLPTILIFEPMLLGGTIIGVILNVMFPDLVILLLLLITLIYATFRTTRKGIEMWRAESQQMALSLNNNDENAMLNEKPYSSLMQDEKKRQNFENEVNDLTERLLNDNETYTSLGDDDINSDDEYIPIDKIKSDTSLSIHSKWIDIAEAAGLKPDTANPNRVRALQPFIEEEKKIFTPLLIMCIIWIVVSLFSIFKSSLIFNVASCGATYWGLTFGVFPILFFITAILAYREVKSFQSKRRAGWLPADGDIEWTAKRSIEYPLIAGFAGLLGGLLGIGGGMIVSPLLLELGVKPRVAAATSALTVLVTSSSATLQFCLLNMLRYDYMLFFMVVGVVGTFIGQTAVNYAIKKYGRPSVIVFIVASVIGIAVILMGANGISNLVSGDIDFTFSTLC